MWYPNNEYNKLNMIQFNFLPSWWNKNYGFTFGEQFTFDYKYRADILKRMNEILLVRFHGLLPEGTTSQLTPSDAPFDNAVTPAAAGCKIKYPLDNYAWNDHLSEQEIDKLIIPADITQIFPYNEIIKQAREQTEYFGYDVKPYLPTRGFLNDAILIAGNDILTDMYLNPERAKWIFDYISLLYDKLIDFNIEHNYKGMSLLTNCTAIMISPDDYREWLLPYDLVLYNRVVSAGMQFFLHHCGVFDKYANVYRAFPHVPMMEIGWGSDIRLALDMFPETTVQYIISPTYFASAKKSDVVELMERIRNTVGTDFLRFNLTVPDLEYGTPDENIQAVIEFWK